jgi:hypothetical protein
MAVKARRPHGSTDGDRTAGMPWLPLCEQIVRGGCDFEPDAGLR